LYRVYKHSTGCQSRLTTGLTTGCRPIVYTAGSQTGLQPGLTTGWTNSCSFNTVVKPVVQPDWQPVVSCKRGIRLMLWFVS